MLVRFSPRAKIGKTSYSTLVTELTKQGGSWLFACETSLTTKSPPLPLPVIGRTIYSDINSLSSSNFD
jgi:hypothetical protein